MGRDINWRRVFTCGSGAGLAWSLLSVPFLVLFGGDIIDTVPRPFVTVGRLGSFVLNIVAGIWAVWLYAAIRPRHGAGFKAAAIAGFSWWLIATIATWQWVDLGFIRSRDFVPLMIASLPALIVVTMFGAWSYRGTREKATSGDLRCAFCNKSQDDVKKLIAGPAVYICDECVRVCVDIIDAADHDDPTGNGRGGTASGPSAIKG